MLYSSLFYRLNSFLRLIRWKNLLIISAVLFGVYQFGSVGDNSNDASFYKYLCAVVLVMAAGNVINDYYDYTIDLVNKPSKVIVGVKLSRTATLSIYIVLNSITFVFIEKLMFGLYAIFTIFILWLYSYFLKKTPLFGNLVVSLLSFFSINLLDSFITSDYPVFVFALLASFVQLLREIIKDLEDIRGDKEEGCRTFPVVFGLQKTKVLIYFISGLFVCSMLYWQWGLQKHVWSLYAVYYLLSVFCVKVYRAIHKSHYSFLSGLLKLMMFVGLTSVLFV